MPGMTCYAIDGDEAGNGKEQRNCDGKKLGTARSGMEWVRHGVTCVAGCRWECYGE